MRVHHHAARRPHLRLACHGVRALGGEELDELIHARHAHVISPPLQARIYKRLAVVQDLFSCTGQATDMQLLASHHDGSHNRT